MPKARVACGVDLAVARPSGVVVAVEGRVSWIGLVSLSELHRRLSSCTVAAVDAPLSLPASSSMRELDKAMVRAGFRVLPPGWRGMRRLTEAAVRLAVMLREVGVEVIETHPRSAWLNSGCRSPIEAACRLLDCSSIDPTKLGRDEVDALVAAAVAEAYMRGVADAVEASDGVLYLLPRGLCSGGRY